MTVVPVSGEAVIRAGGVGTAVVGGAASGQVLASGPPAAHAAGNGGCGVPGCTIGFSHTHPGVGGGHGGVGFGIGHGGTGLGMGHGAIAAFPAAACHTRTGAPESTQARVPARVAASAVARAARNASLLPMEHWPDCTDIWPRWPDCCSPIPA